MDFEIAPLGTRNLIQSLNTLDKCPLCGGARYKAFDGLFVVHYGDCTLQRVQNSTKVGHFYPEKAVLS